MNTPRVSKSDVGRYMSCDEDGVLYKIISFTAKPTFTIESLDKKDRKTFIVGSVESRHLSRLVEEDKND